MTVDVKHRELVGLNRSLASDTNTHDIILVVGIGGAQTRKTTCADLFLSRYDVVVISN